VCPPWGAEGGRRPAGLIMPSSRSAVHPAQLDLIQSTIDGPTVSADCKSEPAKAQAGLNDLTTIIEAGPEEGESEEAGVRRHGEQPDATSTCVRGRNSPLLGTGR